MSPWERFAAEDPIGSARIADAVQNDRQTRMGKIWAQVPFLDQVPLTHEIQSWGYWGFGASAQCVSVVIQAPTGERYVIERGLGSMWHCRRTVMVA